MTSIRKAKKLLKKKRVGFMSKMLNMYAFTNAPKKFPVEMLTTEPLTYFEKDDEKLSKYEWKVLIEPGIITNNIKPFGV